MFLHFLLYVGEGNLQDLPDALTGLASSVSAGKDVKAFIDFVFPGPRSRYRDEIWVSKQKVLMTRNACLEVLNNSTGALIPMSINKIYKCCCARKIEKSDEYELQYPVSVQMVSQERHHFLNIGFLYKRDTL